MEIAVLGWGSLVWDPRGLRIRGKWHSDGPFLPVEFRRYSKGGRITLVIHPGVHRVQILWACSAFRNLHRAIRNLRDREEIRPEDTKRIGYVSIYDKKFNSHVVHCAKSIIENWALKKELGAVIWTDLPQNPDKFREKTCMELNDDNIIKYLGSRTGETLEKAREYIQKAPEQIDTKLRRKISQKLGWSPVSSQ